MRHPFLNQLRSLLLLTGVITLFGGFLFALWGSYQTAATMIEFASQFGGAASIGELVQARLVTFGTLFAGVVGYFVAVLFATDAIRWMLNVEDHLYNLRPDIKTTADEGMVAADYTQVDAYEQPSLRWYERAGDWLTGLAGTSTSEVAIEDAPDIPEIAPQEFPAIAATHHMNGATQAEGAAVAHDDFEPAAHRLPEQLASSSPPFVETDSVPIVPPGLDGITAPAVVSAQIETYNPSPKPMMAAPQPAPAAPEPEEDITEEASLAPLEPEPEPAMRPLSKHQRLGVTGELRKLPKTGRLGKKDDNGPANKQKQAELHFQRAMKYFKKENYKKAGQHFYQAVRLDPDHENAKQGYERCRELVQQGEVT